MCGIKEVKPYADELVSYCGKKMGFDTPPELFFVEDEKNAKKKAPKSVDITCL